MLSIVVPVHKEEKNIKPFLARVEDVMAKMDIAYEIVFCCDPSPDHTESIITQEIERNLNIKLILFSRRFGQPAATMAGIAHCQGDYCVVIDVDLQDPPELIPELFAKLKEGYEVVYAKRRSRKGESVIRKSIAQTGYAVINKIADVEIPRNTGDFRIMTRRVMDALNELNETHGFLRGLVAFVGFKQTAVEYDRDARFKGVTNYNRFTGSIKISMNGLICFSNKPLFLLSILGGIFFLLSILFAIIMLMFNSALIYILLNGMLFFTSIQMLCFGLLGAYVGRIYDEVKRRPMYIVDKWIVKK